MGMASLVFSVVAYEQERTSAAETSAQVQDVQTALTNILESSTPPPLSSEILQKLSPDRRSSKSYRYAEEMLGIPMSERSYEQEGYGYRQVRIYEKDGYRIRLSGDREDSYSELEIAPLEGFSSGDVMPITLRAWSDFHQGFGTLTVGELLEVGGSSCKLSDYNTQGNYVCGYTMEVECGGFSAVGGIVFRGGVYSCYTREYVDNYREFFRAGKDLSAPEVLRTKINFFAISETRRKCSRVISECTYTGN